MKKSSLFIAAVLSLGVAGTLKAELPSLEGSAPIVTLPHTFSFSSPASGLIDINNDGTGDFEIEFDVFSSSGSYSYSCYFESLNSNQVIVEYEGYISSAPGETKAPLSAGGPRYVSLLERGELIGATLPDEMSWRLGGLIMGEPNYKSPSLGATTQDGVYSGYIGTYFSAGTDHYYGWLNVEVDPNETWVTIHSAGYGTAPEAPVPAGLGDPFAVPVPLIASVLGLGLIGGGIFLKRRKK